MDFFTSVVVTPAARAARARFLFHEAPGRSKRTARIVVAALAGQGSRRVSQLQYAAQVKIFQAFGTSDFGIGAQGPTKELPRM